MPACKTPVYQLFEYVSHPGLTTLHSQARLVYNGAMSVLDRLEQRVALPGDTETQRSQKTMLVAVALFGFVATLFNAWPMFQGGLDTMGWTYIGSAVYILLGAVAMLAWPRGFNVFAFLLLLDVLIFPPVTQVLSGGFASGMVFMTWTILAPLGAVLVLGMRATLAQFGLFVITVLLIAALEPYSNSIAPEITSQVRLGYNVPSLISLALIVTAASLYLLRQVERFRQRADDLLLNTLPRSVAERLKSGAQTIADGYDSVTVLFADIVNFTQMSADADPAAVVRLLNRIFSDFDDLAARHGLEKIKTVGDAYMVAAGLPEPRPDHTEAVAAFALDLLDAAASHTDLQGDPICLRVGINTGPVVAGVIGRQKFNYDIWGDAVNVASRMESNGLVSQIQVTAAVRERLAGLYEFIEREPIPIKGKGLMVTYLLVRP